LKMNRDSAIHLAELLSYAVHNKISDSSVNLILDCLDKVADDIDAKTAKSVVWSLKEMRNFLPSHYMLLKKCWSILAERVEQFSYKEVEDLLYIMVKKFSWKYIEFYHEDFVDSCAEYMVRKDCGFDNGSWILRKLSRLVS
jgi:hypothetical protein